MKIIKTIKLHLELRIKQEALFDKVVGWSQKMNEEECPNLNEYKSVNKAVRKIEDKLPGIYFFISDVLGGSCYYIKRKSKEMIMNDETKY